MSSIQLLYKPHEGQSLKNAMEIVSEKKFIFGHQSVGYNIMDGVNLLEEKTGINLNVRETRDFKSFQEPGLIHFAVGSNKDPNSKVDDFVKLMNEISVDSNAIASFKFCYIDIRRFDNVDSVFGYYKENMLKLKELYPEAKMFLFTSPYRAIQKGPKGLLKKIMGKPAGEVENNIRRAKFNEMLIDELSSEFPVFDLGKVESTRPDGQPFTFKWKGKTYPSIYPKYTFDRGHLNKFGSEVVATNLIYFLANEIN
ncbi:MAG: hypothetical protein JW894_15995 [Bacteroidales bacterium]|nr:hypothetical protein [Bacteroidales bacterium]